MQTVLSYAKESMFLVWLLMIIITTQGKELATSTLLRYHSKMTSQFGGFLESLIKPSFT
jgi:hypothetical protein